MRSAFPLLAALALSACASVPTAAPITIGGNVRQDGHATLGQSTRIGKLIVTPQAIVEDSRCPINARCVWAGRLVVAARIDSFGWHETHKLTLGEPLALHATTLILTSAEPGKLAGAETPAQPLLFGFEGGR